MANIQSYDTNLFDYTSNFQTTRWIYINSITILLGKTFLHSSLTKLHLNSLVLNPCPTLRIFLQSPNNFSMESKCDVLFCSLKDDKVSFKGKLFHM